MNELAHKRLSQNFKQSIKYLTLIFNDFFILALIFLLGALMFWYAQSMKTMPQGLWFYQPLTAVILWLPLLTGHLVTLIKEADVQFLFTQDRYMQKYLKPMIKYSMILPIILEILLSGVVFPFADLKAGISILNYFSLVISFIFMKRVELLVEENNLYFNSNRFSFWLLNLITFILAIIGVKAPTILLILSIIFLIIGHNKVNKKKDMLFDWRFAFENENNRKNRVYIVFSMFTDVTERRVNIKRRKYLDFLLPKSLANENPNQFLYRRSLLRNPTYLNLLVRMTIFAILISGIVQDINWAVSLSALVIFLTFYQLFPLVTEFDNNIMYHVYPIKTDSRGVDLVKVLKFALYLQWLIISIFWLIVLPFNIKIFIASLILLIFVWLLTVVYLPKKAIKQ